tara:strand:+ start:11750 stop:11980 length:231 start_codon:yes stop_codon:yes gene_type:complete
MTVKTFLQELAHTGGKALGRVGTAAVEALRETDFRDETSDRCSDETESFYRNSPHGDGRYGVKAYLKPHDTHDAHS